MTFSPRELFTNGPRIYHMTSRLYPEQVMYRLLNMLKLRRISLPDKYEYGAYISVKGTASERPFDREALSYRRDHEDARRTASRIDHGEFPYLNREKGKLSMNWNPDGATRLQTFRRHAFYFGFDLAKANYSSAERSVSTALLPLMMDWIRSNRSVQGDAWHPYTISRRTVNWMLSLKLLQEQFREYPDRLSRIRHSIAFQLSVLERSLERDLRGNHLIANAVALLIGGTEFEQSDWRYLGWRILMEQLEEQILSDGGHYERSPMYHAMVLRDLLDARLFLPPGRRSQLDPDLKGMIEFFSGLRRRDGRYPLFNDAVHVDELSVDRLRTYAERQGVRIKPRAGREETRFVRTFEDTGFYRIHRNDVDVVIDGGPFGPGTQPGHGHCDLFSYVLNKGEEPVVVDSGVYGYEPDSMRSYCRGTTGHNTLQISGYDQSDIWDAFRVGRMARPRRIELDGKKGVVQFSGTYRHGTLDLYHSVQFLIGDSFLIRRDRVFGSSDPKKEHTFENRIHLHPDVQTNILDGPEHGVHLVDRHVRILSCGTEPTLESGWYCPAFGDRREKEVVTFRQEASLPFRTAYVVLIHPEDVSVTVQSENRNIRLLTSNGLSCTVKHDSGR